MPQRYTIAVPVWGVAATRAFTEISLPSQLASGNLPALSLQSEIHYLIATDHESEGVIRSSPTLRKLKTLATVSFTDIDSLPSQPDCGVQYPKKWIRMNSAHEYGIASAIERKSGLLLFCADYVFSDEFLGNCDKRLRNGAKVIAACVPRIEDTIAEDLQRDYRNEEVIACPASDLSQMALDRMHSENFRRNILTNKYINSQNLIVFSPYSGYIRHTTRLVPVASIPSPTSTLNGYTLDSSRFIESVTEDENLVATFEDASENALFSTTHPQENTESDYYRTFNAKEFAQNLADSQPSKTRWALFNRRYIIKGNSSESFSNIENLAISSVSEIKRHYWQQIAYPKSPSAPKPAKALTEDSLWLKTIWPKIEKLVEQLGNRPLAIYGTGGHTSTLLSVTPIVSIAAVFTDREAEELGQYRFGKPYIPIHSIANYAQDILISSQAYEEEIFQFLESELPESINIHRLYTSDDRESVTIYRKNKDRETIGPSEARKLQSPNLRIIGEEEQLLAFFSKRKAAKSQTFVCVCSEFPSPLFNTYGQTQSLSELIEESKPDDEFIICYSDSFDLYLDILNRFDISTHRISGYNSEFDLMTRLDEIQELRLKHALVATLPKSGTLWLRDNIGRALWSQPRTIYGGDWYRLEGLRLNQDKAYEMMTQGGVCACHMDASLQNRQICSTLDLNLIVHIRDPRQGTVSWTYHLNRKLREPPYDDRYRKMELELHSLPESYLEWSFAEQLDYQIDHYLPQAIKWIHNWKTAIDNWPSGRAPLLTTQEQLVKRPRHFNESIASYLCIPSNFLGLDRKPKKGKRHFRTGSTNEWRSLYSNEQEERANSLMPEIVRSIFSDREEDG